MLEEISRQQAIAQGLKRYFNGKPCKHGHLAERYVCTKHCVICDGSRNTERMRDWRARNPDKALAASRRANAKNIVKKRIARAKWCRENREESRLESKRWREKNPQRHRDNVKAWKKENPEKDKAYWKNRSARKRGAEGRHTADDVASIRASQKDKCAYCRARLLGGGHLDHIIPLSRGGSNWPRNLQWLCGPCNLSKNNKDPITFALQQGRLL